MVLAGRIDLLDAAARRLVADGFAAHRGLRAHLADAVPWWPLGLPGWSDRWVALGLRTGGRTLLTVWNRGPGGTVHLPVPQLRGREPVWSTVFPTGVSGETVGWDAGTGVLTVTLPAGPVAVTVGAATPARARASA